MFSSSRFLWMGVSSWILFAFLSALTKLFRAELDPLALVIPWIGLNALVVGIYIVLQNGLKGFQTIILQGNLGFFPISDRCLCHPSFAFGAIHDHRQPVPGYSDPLCGNLAQRKSWKEGVDFTSHRFCWNADLYPSAI